MSAMIEGWPDEPFTTDGVMAPAEAGAAPGLGNALDDLTEAHDYASSAARSAENGGAERKTLNRVYRALALLGLARGEVAEQRARRKAA